MNQQCDASVKISKEHVQQNICYLFMNQLDALFHIRLGANIFEAANTVFINNTDFYSCLCVVFINNTDFYSCLCVLI